MQTHQQKIGGNFGGNKHLKIIKTLLFIDSHEYVLLSLSPPKLWVTKHRNPSKSPVVNSFGAFCLCHYEPFGSCTSQLYKGNFEGNFILPKSLTLKKVGIMPKLAKKLTDTAIRNAKPQTKPYKIAAGRGLHLQIKPDGSKFWIFRYRFNFKENSISMGRYPDVSLAKAEERAREAHKLLADNINPSEFRKSEKSSRKDNIANSFETIAREWHSSHMKNWTIHGFVDT